jgi:hypothetical protein
MTRRQRFAMSGLEIKRSLEARGNNFCGPPRRERAPKAQAREPLTGWLLDVGW